MAYLILGVALLAGFLLAGRWFVNAEPKNIIKVAKWSLFGVIGLVVLFFLLTGRIAWALYALPALLPWLLRARALSRMAKNFSRMSGGGSPGMSSEVDSAFLSMSLDHDTGDMDGIVRQGRFEGRHLSALSLPDLMLLYEDYTREDPESARLLGAFLERVHPEWQEGAAESDGPERPASSGPMPRDEACRILGVEEDATEKEIKAAYHRLIANLHPDKGGSAYLAAKINEARDVLLGS